ncbi:MAG: glycerol-3-phosphate 1-O-acyltransferase PlsY [Lachnospiraceae bacterium]|nr:glycerol-3-phosphate 1-O-acyltransferase PlsY [Lachnospiraceae bacterium]
MLVARGISLIIGYICGLFLTGFIIGKIVKVDLTKEGSGNVGTTNTLRILGVPKGALTLLGDMLKGVVAALVVYFIFRNNEACNEGIHLLMLYGCFGAVLGHDFPFYMLSKGGKGIATSAAMVLVCFPRAMPLLILSFILIVYLSRYVSLGSISIAILFAVEVIIFAHLGYLDYYNEYKNEAVIIVVITAALAIFKHRSNIKRLLSGCENKFSFHPKTKN